jgi:hypothetical protein
MCTTVTGCSAKPTASTTIITSSSTCTDCPNVAMGQNWIFPVLTVDTAGLEKMAASIEAEDSSIFAYYATASTLGATATTTPVPGSTSTESTATSTRSSTTRDSSTSSTTHSSSLTSDSTSSTSHSTTSKHSSTSSKTSASSTSTSPSKSGAIQIYNQPCPTPETYFIYEVDPKNAEAQVGSPCDKHPFTQQVTWQGEDSTIDIGPFTAGGYKNCNFKATGWQAGALTCDDFSQVKCKSSTEAIQIDSCAKNCPIGATLDWICTWGE